MKNKEVFLDALIVSMFASGYLNYLFAGTPLQAWKQILVLLSFCVAIKFISKGYRGLLNIYMFVLALAFLTVISSLFNKVDVSIIFRSIFSYVAWVPFFVFAAIGWFSIFSRLRIYLYLFLLVAGAAGLYIDLSGNYFDFLKTEIVDVGYYINFREAKRAEFVFVASTLALPVLAGVYVFIARVWPHEKQLIIGLCALSIAAIATGSFSGALIVLSMILATTFCYGKKLSLSSLIFGALLITFALSLFVSQSEMAGVQIDRILANQSDSSDANSGRINAWLEALGVIAGFSPLEHIGGAGLGTGDIRYYYESGSIPYLGHGESSFLQAYIEAGFSGFLLRLFPYILFFNLYHRRFKSPGDIYVYAFVLITFFATALAPIFGNIPYQVILGLLVGGLYSRKK